MTGCVDGREFFAQNRSIKPNQNFMRSINHFNDSGPDRTVLIHVFKNCISISVATVLEVSKVTVPICTGPNTFVHALGVDVCRDTTI